jgi:3-carboxy-cis,cis-muconate cycloisomerase
VTEPRPPEAVRALFSPAGRRRRYLEVEAALAEAEAELGVIPQHAGEAIARAAAGELDDERIAAAVAARGHTMMAMVEELARKVGSDGGWVHWGATTQNIQQTGDVLVVRDAHGLLVELQTDVVDALAHLGERTADLPMAGRTHWQHAVPITFGLKVAAWTDQMIRHLQRLHQLEPRLLRSMTGGAAGTFASFGDRGELVQAGVARRLSLTAMPVPARSIVDHFAELVCVLGLVCASAQAVAEEVERLMTPEYAEVSEPVPAGAVGSSTMPQKRNPALCGAVIIPAAQVRALVPLALESVIQAHEVDGTRSVTMDRAVEQACVLTTDALTALRELVAGLHVFPERMRANLDLTAGLINAEAVMLALARSVGRQEAHHLVHAIVDDVLATPGARFDDALIADPRIGDALDPGEVRNLLDPTQYLGLAATVARTTSRRAHDVVRGERREHLEIDRSST